MIGIYRITSPSESVYIGRSTDIKERFRVYRLYKCKKQLMLYNSLKKYGSKEHLFNVVHELPGDVSNEVINQYEAFYILQYKHCGIKMLNLTLGGDGCRPHPDTIERMRVSARNAVRPKHTEEAKRKISEGNKGKIVSEESRKKNSASRIGKKKSEDFKAKRREYMKGRKLRLGKKNTEESKIKVSKALSGEGCHLAKLKREDVVDIKRLIGQGVSIKDINIIYPMVNKYNLYHIKSGLTWRHV